jgi:polysaccharide pyruvyl transferase WcaK-like protein
MRLGLLAFHFSDNYGALLQAFCLQQYLRSIGHDPEFINYHPYYVEQGGPTGDIIKPRISRRYLKKVYLFLNYKRQKFLYNPTAIAGLEAFRRDQLCISPVVARNYHELQDQLSSYDHIIVGSDQIWNPSDQYGPDPIYFGYPFSADHPVSSYAASFGSIDRIKPFSEVIKTYLKSLASCSVREKDAFDYLGSIGIESSHVPDPTLLVDDLSLYKSQPPGVDLENSVFTYALRSCAGVKDVADILSQTHDL